MKAIVCTEYGPSEVLRLAEFGKPASNNEALIKIHAVSRAANLKT